MQVDVEVSTGCIELKTPTHLDDDHVIRMTEDFGGAFQLVDFAHG